MHNRGFSLVELLVVITVIGALAAIAVPTYRHYSAKSSIAASLAIGDSILTKLKETYDKTGAFPTAMTFAGQSATYGTSIFPNVQNIPRIQYGNNPPDTRGRMIVVHVGPVGGYPSGAGAVGLGIRYINGAYKFTCGNPGTGNVMIDSSLLPSHCTCQNVDAWADLGQNASGCPSQS